MISNKETENKEQNEQQTENNIGPFNSSCDLSVIYNNDDEFQKMFSLLLTNTLLFGYSKPLDENKLNNTIEMVKGETPSILIFEDFLMNFTKEQMQRLLYESETNIVFVFIWSNDETKKNEALNFCKQIYDESKEPNKNKKKIFYPVFPDTVLNSIATKGMVSKIIAVDMITYYFLGKKNQKISVHYNRFEGFIENIRNLNLDPQFYINQILKDRDGINQYTVLQEQNYMFRDAIINKIINSSLDEDYEFPIREQNRNLVIEDIKKFASNESNNNENTNNDNNNQKVKYVYYPFVNDYLAMQLCAKDSVDYLCFIFRKEKEWKYVIYKNDKGTKDSYPLLINSET